MRIRKSYVRIIARRALLLLSGIVILHGGTAYAQSFTTQDLKDINNVSPWYDPNFGGCTTGKGVSTTLVGTDNVEKAYNYFLGAPRSFKDFQAAGVVGNLMQESGVNPKSNQVGGGPGRGIAQWSVDGRWVVLTNWARDHGNRDIYALDTQLDFVWYEMNEIAPWKEALPAVKSATTVEQAVEGFEKNYEKAGKPNYPNRIKYARQVLNKYGGGGATVNPETGEAVSECPAESGGQTEFIDGFTVYNQCDPAWGNKPFGSSKICPSGCGPSAMAMIVTALTGQRITPDVVAEYAGEQGMYVPGAGSSWSIAPVVAKKWGLKASPIGADAAKINQTLQNGGLVVTSGKGGLPFTSGGHYIVIRAVTASGKWKIGDSGHKNTSAKEWDPATILANMNDGSVYAITKFDPGGPPPFGPRVPF